MNGNVVYKETPLGTQVRAMKACEGHRRHEAGATGKLARWSGTLCVVIDWDEGCEDTYGYFCRRFELAGGPW